MRSYPRVVSRALRETLSRGPTGRALSSTLSFRSPSSTPNQVVVASGAVASSAPSVQGALRATVPRQRNQGGGETDDLLRRWGGLCAAAAAATALAADGHIENKQVALAAGAGADAVAQQQQQRRQEQPPPVGDLPVGRHAVADAVESASPWVVNILSGSGMSAGKPSPSSPGLSWSLLLGFGGMKWDSGSARNMGSGFVISGDGLVVTNAHVVEKYADGVVVVTLDGGEKLKKGKVQAMDRRFDIALLKVNVPPSFDLPVAKIGRSVTLRAGEFVVAMGSPQGLSKSCTLGIVSATARRRSELVADQKTETMMSDSADFIQTDAAIASGNSGGPLIDLDGRVIGINTLKLSGTEGVGFAIPIDMAWQASTLSRPRAAAVIEELRTRGRVDRPQLGMRLVTTDNGNGKLNGVMILSVTPGGAAERAGLRFGDLITEFDGKAVTNTTEVLQLIGHRVGRTIPLTVVAAANIDGGQQEPQEPRHLTVVTASDLPPPTTATTSGGGGGGGGGGSGGG
ncbi:unnamed protein product, partial [Hapterophycus canaliculatus]